MAGFETQEVIECDAQAHTVRHREDEARALLKQVATLTPRPSMRIEDIKMRGAAASRLATLGEAKNRVGG